MKAKVNSKIAPVERFGISTPARSRGSNRDSRLQKKFQIDQEVDPALRFAPVGHPCPPVALVKFYQRRVLFCFLFFDMGSQKTIIRSLLKVVARFNPVTFPPFNPVTFPPVGPFFNSCHYFCFGRGKIRPLKICLK